MDPTPSIKIEEPFHGAVLNYRHGQQTAAGLKIRVSGRAVAGGSVTVNGIPARRSGERFAAEVMVREKEPEIAAVLQLEGCRVSDRVRVLWDRFSRPRYRFSIDDNSFFLRDVFQHGYASLFDCFYLKMLRDLHRQYGTKFTVNIYYTTGGDFNLTQFPDCYKNEWLDNADWLKLAFHAQADKPDRPYQDAPPAKLIADLDQVAGQIHRFAGAEAYAPPTVIHWAMTRRAAFKPLAERGVRALSGFFARAGEGWDEDYHTKSESAGSPAAKPRSTGNWDINYRLDDQHSAYLCCHDAWKDFPSGIIFSRADICCNAVALGEIAATLDAATKDPNTAEIMDLFTHEQYFWPFYCNYLPDHCQRVEAAIRWVAERGYSPVFFHEGLLGGREE
jgi:hypothetical protein